MKMRRTHVYIVGLIMLVMAVPLALMTVAQGLLPSLNDVSAGFESNGSSGGQASAVEVALAEPADPIALQSRLMSVQDTTGRSRSVLVRMTVRSQAVATAICEAYPRLADQVQIYLHDHRSYLPRPGQANDADQLLLKSLKGEFDPRAVEKALVLDYGHHAVSSPQTDIWECSGKTVRRVARKSKY